MPLKLTSINELDIPQRKVIEHKPFMDNIHVTGPPGSGKTIVAVLRAQMLVSGGFTNLLFLTYNHSVVSFVQAMFKEMNLSSNVTVNNKDAFFRKLGSESGHSFAGYDPYEEKYARLMHHLQSRRLHTSHQIVILDEVQDFLPEEIEILKSISEKIIAVGDYDQKISNVDDNSNCFYQFPKFSLGTIYRYGTTIAKMAQKFATTHYNLEGMVTKSSSTAPYRIICSSNGEAVDSVARIIQNRKYADTTMGIISPTKDNLKNLKQLLRYKGISVFYPEKDNKEYRDHNFDLKIPVLLTADSAKGTEFDCIILYGFNEGSIFKQRKERLFVSLTRANNELYLIQESNTISELKNSSLFFTMTESNVETSVTDF